MGDTIYYIYAKGPITIIKIKVGGWRQNSNDFHFFLFSLVLHIWNKNSRPLLTILLGKN